jgi:formylmethanofuran dehydrogenase subunit B
MNSRLFADAVCLGCGVTCDDVDGELRGREVVHARRLCPLGRRWLAEAVAAPSPGPTIDGRPVAWAEAVREAAACLASARAPLVTGLARSSVEATREALALADRCGATIDVLVPSSARARATAFQQEGLSTCSLGELRLRADLVLLWRVDPARSHPRLSERCWMRPTPDFPAGRADRTIARVCGPGEPPFRDGDVLCRIGDGDDRTLLEALRAELRGVGWRPDALPGVSQRDVAALAEALRRSRYAAVLWGAELAAGPQGTACVAELLRLVRELNDGRRCAALPLVEGDGAETAEQVLTWQTGFPLGVGFAGGFPQYDLYGHAADALLSRREVDRVLLVGCRRGDAGLLGPAALEHLAASTVVAVGGEPHALTPRPRVWLPTARLGYDAEGTVARMDGTLLPVRRLAEPAHPAEHEALAAIAALR